MAPEQVIAARVDGRADQFSLGVIAFELLTGRRPFGGPTTEAVLFAIVQGERPAAHEINNALPPAVSEVLRRGLAKEPASRFTTCAAFLEALETALVTAPSPAASMESRTETAKPEVLMSEPRSARPRFTFIATLGGACLAGRRGKNMKTRRTFLSDLARHFSKARKSMVRAVLCLAVCMFGLGISASAEEPQPTFITIDIAGAGTSANQGTFALSVNDAGVITGWYTDAGGVNHGFLRTADGRITTFNAPGAGESSGAGTVAYMINLEGAIVGADADPSGVNRGYLRAPDGSFTPINAPGAGTESGLGTLPGSINFFGTVLGGYFDANSVGHGFLRALNGEITGFEAPGAGNTAGQGTFPAANSGINNAGSVTGSFVDSNNVGHGFVRFPNGAFTTFDVTGAGNAAYQGTNLSDINSEGAVTGYYLDSNYGYHGFLRAPDGSITTFDYPGVNGESIQGTLGIVVNDAGWVVGQSYDINGVWHGFLRAPDGKFFPIDDPSAGTESGAGTFPLYLNNLGVITGLYEDSAGVNHGFLWLPGQP